MLKYSPSWMRRFIFCSLLFRACTVHSQSGETLVACVAGAMLRARVDTNEARYLFPISQKLI